MALLIFSSRAVFAGIGLSNSSTGFTFGGPPAPPTNLTATPSSLALSIVLNWTASSNTTSYIALRCLTQNGTYSQVGNPTTATTFTDTTVSAGTTYWYEVEARNSYGTSGPSNKASALTIPAAPANFTATAGDTIVSLSWSAAQSATSYTIGRSLTNGGQPVATFTVANTAFIDSDLLDGTTYFYTVFATNGTGSGPKSSAQATPSGSSPPSAGGLTAEYSESGPSSFVAQNDVIVDSSTVAMPPSGTLPNDTQIPVNPIPINAWSCRWSGYVKAPVTGTYWFQQIGTFSCTITVNGTVVDNYTQYTIGGQQYGQWSVSLTAGQTYTIIDTMLAQYPVGYSPQAHVSATMRMAPLIRSLWMARASTTARHLISARTRARRCGQGSRQEFYPSWAPSGRTWTARSVGAGKQRVARRLRSNQPRERAFQKSASGSRFFLAREFGHAAR